MTAPSRVVIVGGGIAAVRCAQALRELGHAGQIVLLSEELEHPYDRPPLSKTMLAADDARPPVALLTPEDADTTGIDVRLGHRVTSINIGSRTVNVDDSQMAIPYDALVIATGTRARELPLLAGISGVHHLRTAADARAIRDHLAASSALTVIGAGFIGLEIAAVARARGCEVTVIEAADRPLAHILGTDLAGWLQDWHSERGVHFLCGSSVREAANAEGKVALILDDGREVVSDAVVVGVGVRREVDWMARSGLTTHVGLVCDMYGRTSDPHVFGAGDVVCTHHDGECAPSAHWTAASESGRRVARTVLGLGPDEQEDLDEHYFWSDQAGLRLMAVGRLDPAAEVEIAAGDLASGRFVAHWTQDGRVVAVLGVNNPKDFLRGRLAYRQDQAISASGSR